MNAARVCTESWKAEQKIALHTAFSRDQSQKVYVQHRLRETAEDIWRLLEAGAHLYVCGEIDSV
jgi:sulfite reductase (NADPH) flavoprotein alpha-component